MTYRGLIDKLGVTNGSSGNRMWNFKQCSAFESARNKCTARATAHEGQQVVCSETDLQAGYQIGFLYRTF